MKKNNPSKILIIISFLFALWGAIALFFLWNTGERDIGFYVANLIFHIPLLCGFVWLIIWGSAKFRIHPFWTPLGILMIVWPLITVYFADFMDPEKAGFKVFLQISETPLYGIAFGILFGFFSLKSLKKFWYFFIPIAFAWNIQHASLLLQSFGVPIKSGSGAPMIQTYFSSGKFWNDWGWFLSDMIVDIPIALSALFMIVLSFNHEKLNKYERF